MSILLLTPSFFVPHESEINQALEEQFLLVYHGECTWQDVEVMTPFERDWFLNRLLDEKEKEKEARANAEAKARAKQTPRSRLR